MNPDPMAQRKKARSIALAVRFSNRPFGVKRFQTIHHHSVDVTSRARASLRNQHHGSSIMGFEDEMEQSEKRENPALQAALMTLEMRDSASA
jgi:hypothetical protein